MDTQLCQNAKISNRHDNYYNLESTIITQNLLLNGPPPYSLALFSLKFPLSCFGFLYNTSSSQRMQGEGEKLKYNLGQNVDVRDTKKKWVNGQIIFIKGFQAYIHYSGWSSRYDQYIDVRTDRILPQWEPGKQITINNRIDAYHPNTGWLQGRVAGIQYEQGTQKVLKVKAHYFNFHSKYDRWIDFNDPSQMALIGSKSKAYGIGKSRLKKKSQGMTMTELYRKILQMKIEKMKQELSQEDYVVKNIEGDGNCLFRSISDQLYGTEQHHREIRQVCLKYIWDQKYFFEHYVTEDLKEYVDRKSQDGIWGDDVEIQALSEIYARPIEIYSTSSKPLRTFHEDNQSKVEPLRLAYVGSCHYSSIKKKNRQTSGLLQSPFGQFEAIFTAGYHQSENGYHHNMRKYRQFFSNSNAIDYALEENVEASERKEENVNEKVQQFQKKEMRSILEISESENILEQIEKAEMQQLQNKIEQEQVEEEMRRIEERQLEMAREMSKRVKKDPSMDRQKDPSMDWQKDPSMDWQKDPSMDRPYWFQGLLSQGYTQKEVLFAIEINGYDPDLVQNFLLDNS